jgi:NAD(P)-dependent dehydrogenase (short-subunit alcohol dehydrogenase family)
MTGRLDGKTAVITGGSNGIGRACAERFSAEGANVLIADLLPEPGAAAVEAITGAGGRAAFVELEAASEEANEAMAAAAVEHFGSIDVVVTAAGVSSGDYLSGDVERGLKRMAQAAEAQAVNPAAPLTDLDLDDWRRVLDVNLTGTLLALRATAAVMVDQGTGGSIVTIASIAARDPLWGAPSYPVSKAGVWMLTKNASRTLAPLGIRVNSIGPGFIDTNMTAALDQVDEYHDRVIALTPMGRKGQPSEIANVALFLASDEASYVTGELIHPDGGWFTG